MRVVGSGRTRGAGARRAGAAVLVIVLAVLTGLGYVVVALSTSAVHEEARARVRTTAAVGATVIQREMVGMRTLVDSFARRTLLVRAVGQPADGPHLDGRDAGPRHPEPLGGARADVDDAPRRVRAAVTHRHRRRPPVLAQ